MAVNLVTYFVDSTEVAARSAEVPDADFTGGMNRGGSCAPGLGINTGDYDPKEQDWNPPGGVPAEVRESQQIGGALSGILVLDPATVGDDELTQFVTALAPIAPDDIIETVAGFAMRNRTGKTIPSGSSAWGVADQV